MKKIILILNILFISSCTFKDQSSLQKTTSQQLLETGKEYLRVGDLNQAKLIYESVLDEILDPEALDALGCVAFYQKEYELAKKYFIQAEELNQTLGGKYEGALFNLAVVYEVLGEKDLAKYYYRMMLNKYGDMRAQNNLTLLNDPGLSLGDAVSTQKEEMS